MIAAMIVLTLLIVTYSINPSTKMELDGLVSRINQISMLKSHADLTPADEREIERQEEALMRKVSSISVRRALVALAFFVAGMLAMFAVTFAV